TADRGRWITAYTSSSRIPVPPWTPEECSYDRCKTTPLQAQRSCDLEIRCAVSRPHTGHSLGGTEQYQSRAHDSGEYSQEDFRSRAPIKLPAELSRTFFTRKTDLHRGCDRGRDRRRLWRFGRWRDRTLSSRQQLFLLHCCPPPRSEVAAELLAIVDFARHRGLNHNRYIH